MNDNVRMRAQVSGVNTVYFDDSTLGGRLNHARVVSGLSQGALAEAVGAESGASISHWETGRRLPNVESMRRLLVPMPRLSLHWLITGEGDWTTAGESA